MSVLVCVTGQKNCERLIVAGVRIARAEGLPLNVLHVVQGSGSVLGFVNEPEALEYLLKVSVEHGASMYVRRSDDVIASIEYAAKNEHCRVLVAGRAANYSGHDLLDELQKRLPGVRFEIMRA
jgi:K+-sensing histidine kinase KdpD